MFPSGVLSESGPLSRWVGAGVRRPGRAGSGKSILTIGFVLDLLEAREPHDRVPVIFGIGSWAPTAVAPRDWLIDRLVRDHPHLSRRAPGGPTVAAALVDADLVLPVLDGFDDIAEGLRSTALEVLHHTSLPLVLTSRHEEFAEAVREAGVRWSGPPDSNWSTSPSTTSPPTCPGRRGRSSTATPGARRRSGPPYRTGCAPRRPAGPPRRPGS